MFSNFACNFRKLYFNKQTLSSIVMQNIITFVCLYILKLSNFEKMLHFIGMEGGNLYKPSLIYEFSLSA